MNEALVATLVVVFREALEAGLIVGIVLTVLHRLGAMRYAPSVWASVLLAVAASGLAGWGISRLTAAGQEHWTQLLEGVISLIACGVLTHMVFWMHQQARRLRSDIEARVESAVSRQERVAVALLPFLAVFREGAETVLFLAAVAIQSGGSVSLVGGVLGGILAVTVTAAIFVGGRTIPLKPLFTWTGMLLLLMAAGMLAYGIHELEEAGWVPPIISPVWNINHVLNDKEGLGSFLKAIFGYNGNPSLTEVVCYAAYLLGVGTALRRWKPPAKQPA